MNATKRAALSTLSVLLMGFAFIGVVHAQVQVTSADPPAAPQGTLSLDVTIEGNGFDSSAQVEFLVTGTTNPGGVIVKKVSVRGAKKLVATIDITDTAVIDKFDIKVSLSNGRKGIGTTLFAVQSKAISGACASATVPAFAFSTRPGKYQTPQVYVADTSGACTRFVGGLTDGPYYYSRSQQFAFRLIDAATPGGPVTGRIAIHDQVRGVVLMEFTVNPNVVGMQLENVHQIALGFQSGWGDLALSPDGQRLAVVQYQANWPTQGDYTYRLLVTDVAVCIADLQNCTPTLVYTETTRDTKVAFAVPRWGSDGHVYLERTTAANLLNPLIVRVSADPPYSTALEVLVQSSGRRVRLFDVQDTIDGDVIVFGESLDLRTQYCYVVKTVSVSSCNLGACAVTSTNMIASYFTSAESVGTSTKVLTQRVSLNNCTTYPTIDRGEAIDGSAATMEPLISKGEEPSSAN